MSVSLASPSPGPTEHTVRANWTWCHQNKRRRQQRYFFLTESLIINCLESAEHRFWGWKLSWEAVCTKHGAGERLVPWGMKVGTLVLSDVSSMCSLAVARPAGFSWSSPALSQTWGPEVKPRLLSCWVWEDKPGTWQLPDLSCSLNLTSFSPEQWDKVQEEDALSIYLLIGMGKATDPCLYVACLGLEAPLGDYRKTFRYRKSLGNKTKVTDLRKFDLCYLSKKCTISMKLQM